MRIIAHDVEQRFIYQKDKEGLWKLLDSSLERLS